MRCLLLPVLFLLSLLMQAQHSQLSKERLAHKVDSLQQLFRTAANDSVRMRAFAEIARQYDLNNDFKRAKIYNKYTKELAEALKTSPDAGSVRAGKRGEAEYYFRLGDIQKKQGDYRQALDNYFRSLDLNAALGDKPVVASLRSNIAAAYAGIGNYSQSLNYCLMALKDQEAIGNKRQIALEQNNLGAIYSDLHSYARALMYFARARDIAVVQKDKASEALYTGNIGHCYQMLCDSAFAAGNNKLSLDFQAKALDYYFEALQMSEETAEDENAAVCLENIGITYSNVDDYEKGLPYLLRALELYEKLGRKAEQSYCLSMIGIAYQGLGQQKKAEAFFLRSLDLAEQTKSNYYLMEASLAASEFYEKIKRHDEALAYYRDYTVYKDSIYNNKSTQAFSRAELDYEFQKKAAELKHQNDRVLYQLEAGNKLHRQWRLFFLVTIALILVVLFFVKRAYDNKKKLATLLEEEDRRKEVLLQEVHHRINNNLQIISSLLTLQANDADNERLTEYLTQSQNRIQTLSAMHELLSDTNSPLEIGMKSYLSKVLDFHREVAASKPTKIVIREEIEAVSFPTRLAVQVALIINELVTNSLKYAFAGKQEGTVTVSLRQHGSVSWMVGVSDDGIGFSSEDLKHKDSLGLKLIHIMTRQIEGRFEAQNEKGSHFTLIFNPEPKR